jgi:hypothetical protein
MNLRTHIIPYSFPNGGVINVLRHKSSQGCDDNLKDLGLWDHVARKTQFSLYAMAFFGNAKSLEER